MRCSIVVLSVLASAANASAAPGEAPLELFHSEPEHEAPRSLSDLLRGPGVATREDFERIGVHEIDFSLEHEPPPHSLLEPDPLFHPKTGLARYGFQVIPDIQRSAAAALDRLARREVQLRITDADDKRLAGFDGIAVVPRVELVAPVRARAPHALVVVQRSKDPSAALASLSESPARITVVYDLPRSATQLKAIHGRAAAARVSAATLQLIGAFADTFAAAAQATPSVSTIDLSSVGDGVRATVLKHLRQRKPDELTLIIGHNADGRLRFHDRGEIAVATLAKQPRVWVLACDTIDDVRPAPTAGVATTRPITYPLALAAARRAVEAMGPAGSYRQGLESLQKNDWAVGVVGLALFIRSLLDDDDHEETHGEHR